MNSTTTNVNEYIESLEPPMQSDVAELHKLILTHMPDVQPRMWEGTFWGGSTQRIIGYGDMTFTRSDKKVVEWFMVGLTQQKNYISVYICATEDGKYIVKKYGDTLGKVKLGSSSISFKKMADVDVEALMKLVDKAYDQLNAQ